MQKMRTSQQKVQKMLNEEKTILDLELAVKKAKFQKENEITDDWSFYKKSL